MRKFGLEKRPYRLKRPVYNFLCPLCSTPRSFSFSSRLSKANYIQILMTSSILSLTLYPFMGIRSFISFFVVWALFEVFIKLAHRREVPCPYCGFDAAWYKRDVKVAKKIVQDFWTQKKAHSHETSGQERASV